MQHLHAGSDDVTTQPCTNVWQWPSHNGRTTATSTVITKNGATRTRTGKRRKRKRATTTTTTTTAATTTTTAKPTNEGPMKGQKQVKHTHQIQCQLSFKKQTKTQTVISGIRSVTIQKELTHLSIKTIIAITTWTKMGAHSKSWIMTHDA